MNYNNTVSYSNYAPLTQTQNSTILPNTDGLSGTHYGYWISDLRNCTPDQIATNKVARGYKNKNKLSDVQQETLCQEFEKEMFPSKPHVYELAEKMSLSYSFLKLWYRNKRAKVKKQNGGIALLAREKAKHLKNQNSMQYLIKQEPIDNNANIDPIPATAHEIWAKSRNFGNLSLRDLLSQAPTIPQLRPSSTSSSGSLCSDSASDSADSASAEYHLNEDHSDLMIKKEIKDSAEYFPKFTVTYPVVNKSEIYSVEQFQDKREIIKMPNNVTHNPYTESPVKENNLVVNNLNHVYYVNANNSNVSQNQYYHVNSKASVPQNYIHNTRVSEQNYYQNGNNTTRYLTSPPDHKYYAKRPNQTTKRPTMKETNIQVQSVLVLPAIQQQLNFGARDKYSLASNLTVQDVDFILSCDPLEQRKGFVSLLNLLDELHSRGCDCSKCM